MPMRKPLFDNPPWDIRSPLLRAAFLGRRDKLNKHVPEEAQINLRRWQGEGASGFSRCVLSYLATHLHHVPRQPHVPLYNHGLDRSMARFWEALPQTLFDEALEELREISDYQKADLMKYADEEGCIIGLRSYEDRQAEAIIQEMQDNPDADLIEVPTWLLHSFNIREEFSSYGVCWRRPVQIECKIPVSDVFLSTYHIAGDDNEIGRDQFHHIDKELIVLNRSPSGKFPVSRKQMRLHDPEHFMANQIAYGDRKKIQNIRSEFLYSPIFSDIQHAYGQVEDLRINSFNKLIDRCTSKLRQGCRPGQ